MRSPYADLDAQQTHVPASSCPSEVPSHALSPSPSSQGLSPGTWESGRPEPGSPPSPLHPDLQPGRNPRQSVLARPGHCLWGGPRQGSGIHLQSACEACAPSPGGHSAARAPPAGSSAAPRPRGPGSRLAPPTPAAADRPPGRARPACAPVRVTRSTPRPGAAHPASSDAPVCSDAPVTPVETGWRRPEFVIDPGPERCGSGDPG
ncbi:PREDICTED: basic proline-rich protein-like [Chinchilla lanigera]|uniref:basic proline-rich protein-like n=1 Tax=Chinchilla lanigera TaxID=34839 RepID=UPI0006971C4A|nr:PREDICTED: basic proline-rich protein-like [Chinchilla lanigera]